MVDDSSSNTVYWIIKIDVPSCALNYKEMPQWLDTNYAHGSCYSIHMHGGGYTIIFYDKNCYTNFILRYDVESYTTL